MKPDLQRDDKPQITQTICGCTCFGFTPESLTACARPLRAIRFFAASAQGVPMTVDSRHCEEPAQHVFPSSKKACRDKIKVYGLFIAVGGTLF